jgi:outer membrane protein OmpU
MKKILLATTVLVGTAGFAFAEVALTGSATMGVAREGNDVTKVAANDGETYSSAGLAIAMSAESDNGLAFGASVSMTAGQTYSFGDSADGFTAESGAFGEPEVFISSEFGKLSAKQQGYNFFVNDSDDDNADLKFSATVAGVTVAGVYDEATDETSANLSYAADALSVSVAYDSFNDGAMAAVGYTAGPITGTLTVKNEVAGANSIKVAYAQDGISASIKMSDDESWEVEGGYAANGVTIGLKTTSADAWKATGAYDLGAGAKLEGGINHTQDAYAGVSFAF